MYIGIDIGGTHTRIAGSPSLNNITLIGKKIISTPKTFKQGIFEISKNIKRISNNPKSIGIGLAGRISKNGKEFTHSINLTAWTNQPIIKTLKSKFDCSVYISNDAVAQSQGEAFYGIKPNKNFLYLVWGTGLGGALVSQNKNTPTKLGRLYLDKWEKIYGGKNLKKRFGKSAEHLNKKEWDIVILEFKNSIIELSN
ncbi:MAG: ROK family protein, partial [Actinobacteria bacterium]|nr:ROK family protein [Actinomycetota bacterium]